MTRVGVIGAGPAGLTAAIAARRNGFDVTLFEQMPELQAGGVGITIAANGLSVLDALGLLDEFHPLAQRVTRASVATATGKTLLSLDYETLAGPYKCFAATSRGSLYRLLSDAAAAAGVRLCLAKRCVYADEHGEVCFDDGHREQFDVVIAADGINSTVRTSLGLKTVRRRAGRPVLQWIAARPVPDLATHEIWGTDGRAALVVPLPDGRTHCAYSASPRWNDVLASGLDEWILSWREYPRLVTDPMDAVERWGAVRHDEIEEVHVRPWHRGRVILVGDAAHAMAPWAGQGASSGMVDSLRLVEALKSMGAIDEAARAYESLRRREVTRFQRFARVGASVRQWSSRPRRLVRDLSLRVLDQSDWALRRQMRFLSGSLAA